eukprot:TRINITY_DN26370_c0_g1_i1.p1 TRINITY_DN26370_c0_g1~~TRINITY_DN26370_c0_g1_i1.p1  ORF type:complete len:1650 (+),score=488.58 TRINITY_DN26370_c0_g1_i1:35-4951(+)
MEYEVRQDNVDVRCKWPVDERQLPVFARDGVVVTQEFIADAEVDDVQPLCAQDQQRCVAAGPTAMCVHSSTNKMFLVHTYGAALVRAIPAVLLGATAPEAQVVGLHVGAGSTSPLLHVAAAAGTTSRLTVTLYSGALEGLSPDTVAAEAHSLEGQGHDAPVVAFGSDGNHTRCAVVFEAKKAVFSADAGHLAVVTKTGNLECLTVTPSTRGGGVRYIKFIDSTAYAACKAELLCNEWGTNGFTDAAWMPSSVGQGWRVVATTHTSLFVMDPFAGGRTLHRWDAPCPKAYVRLPLQALHAPFDKMPFVLVSHDEDDSTIALVESYRLSSKDVNVAVSEAIGAGDFQRATQIAEARGIPVSAVYEMAWFLSRKKVADVRHLEHVDATTLANVCLSSINPNTGPASPAALLQVILTMHGKDTAAADSFALPLAAAALLEGGTPDTEGRISIPSRGAVLQTFSAILRSLGILHPLLSFAKREAAAGRLSRLKTLLRLRSASWDGLGDHHLAEVAACFPVATTWGDITGALPLTGQGLAFVRVSAKGIHLRQMDAGTSVDDSILKSIGEAAAVRASGYGLYSAAHDMLQACPCASPALVKSAREVATLFGSPCAEGRELLFRSEAVDLQAYQALSPVVRLCGMVAACGHDATPDGHIRQLCADAGLSADRLDLLLQFTDIMLRQKQQLCHAPLPRAQLCQVLRGVFSAPRSSTHPTDAAALQEMLDQLPMLVGLESGLEGCLIEAMAASGNLGDAKAHIDDFLEPQRRGAITQQEARRRVQSVAAAIANAAEAVLEGASSLQDSHQLGMCEDILALWDAVREDHAEAVHKANASATDTSQLVDIACQLMSERHAALLEIVTLFPKAAGLIQPTMRSDMIRHILTATDPITDSQVDALAKAALRLGMTRHEVLCHVLSYAKEHWRGDLAVVCCNHMRASRAGGDTSLSEQDAHAFTQDVLSRFGSQLDYTAWATITTQAMWSADDASLAALVDSYADRSCAYTTYYASPFLEGYSAVSLPDTVDQLVDGAAAKVLQGDTAKHSIRVEEALDSTEQREAASRAACVLAERLLRQHYTVAWSPLVLEEAAAARALEEEAHRLQAMQQACLRRASLEAEARLLQAAADETDARGHAYLQEAADRASCLVPAAAHILSVQEDAARSTVAALQADTHEAEAVPAFAHLCDVLLGLCASEESAERDAVLSGEGTMRAALPLMQDEAAARAEVALSEQPAALALAASHEAVHRRGVSAEVKLFYKTLIVAMSESTASADLRAQEHKAFAAIQRRCSEGTFRVALCDTAASATQAAAHLRELEHLAFDELLWRYRVEALGYHNIAHMLWAEWRFDHMTHDEAVRRDALSAEEERDFASLEIRADAEQQKAFWWLEQLGSVIVSEEDGRSALREEMYQFHAFLRKAMESSRHAVAELERERHEMLARVTRDLRHLPAEEAHKRREVVMAEADASHALTEKRKKEEYLAMASSAARSESQEVTAIGDSPSHAAHALLESVAVLRGLGLVGYSFDSEAWAAVSGSSLTPEFCELCMAVVSVALAASADGDKLVARSTAFACACRWLCTCVYHVPYEPSAAVKRNLCARFLSKFVTMLTARDKQLSLNKAFGRSPNGVHLRHAIALSQSAMESFSG